MPVDVWAPVLENRRLSGDYSVLALEAPEIARAALPGQFVMLKQTPGLDPLLRRPFSIFEILRDSDGGPRGISILNKRVGTATRQIYDAEPGHRVACLGPLGRPFTVAERGEAWMVAGGVGLAPFATLAEALASRGTAMTLFYGGRSASDLYYADMFESLGARVVLATEDGTRGVQGRITVPLEHHLNTAGDSDVSIFACGPEPMLAAVARLAQRYRRYCEVSVERVMGCGLGGCYSCVIPVRTPGGRPHFVRSCISGPVFDASTVAWD
ncbi:MAG TPA: dihydroorotate dehydrogenase electron transfer subunit [Vicinamibacterales bacterium]|nr:dihydroorotate dehydrogenase electron transfer subunit [Vicinamibacterales bacterium]